MFPSRSITALLAATALAAAGAAPSAFAKDGADDPAGHDVGDDHGGLVEPGDDKGGRRVGKASVRTHHRHRRGRGTDDGPNHT